MLCTSRGILTDIASLATFNSFHPRIRAVHPRGPAIHGPSPTLTPLSFLPLVNSRLDSLLSLLHVGKLLPRLCKCAPVVFLAFCNDIEGKTDTLAVISGTRQQCNRHCPGVRSLENTRSLSNCVATRLNENQWPDSPKISLVKRGRKGSIARNRARSNASQSGNRSSRRTSRLTLLLTLELSKWSKEGIHNFKYDAK